MSKEARSTNDEEISCLRFRTSLDLRHSDFVIPIAGTITTQQRRKKRMPKFVIERELPGAGKLSAEQLQGISQKSCSVLKNLGPQIQWLQSYVTDDKIYCVYIAP